VPIRIAPDKLKQFQASVKRYVAENFDEDIGDLKAGLMLDFVMKEIAPAIYNQAIADAQAYFQVRVTDLDGVCYEPEIAYWPASGPKRQAP
jgi:uncharacterized protein (DUF2164 family)